MVREHNTEKVTPRGPDFKVNSDHEEGLKNFSRFREAFRSLEFEAESGKGLY